MSDFAYFEGSPEGVPSNSPGERGDSAKSVEFYNESGYVFPAGTGRDIDASSEVNKEGFAPKYMNDMFFPTPTKDPKVSGI